MVKAEVVHLDEPEQWVAQKAKGMNGDFLEWEEITPEEAKAKVEADPKSFVGYIVDAEDGEGVFLCKRGGKVYGKANGIGDTWTMHVFRTKGLPAKSSELYTDEFAKDGKMEFRRFGRGEGLADGDEHLCLFGSVDPHDLTQGSVGNCWLISAFAAAAEFPKHVKALCQQQTLTLDGKYDVRLFHPTKDKWEVHTVDDSFPIHNANLKFASMGNQGEIWPCVLEKGLAKMFGSYNALEGNTSLLAFKTMFGAKGLDLISLDREDDGMWTCYTPMFEDEGGMTPDCNKVPAPWLDGFHLDGDKRRPMDDKLFELIEDLDETGCIMCCAAGKPLKGGGKAKKSKGHSGEMIGDAGLVRDHAYTLLRAVDDVAGSGFDLIEMRNPWGQGEWTGAWSDNSDMWDKHPEVKRFLNPTSEDDGKFWISKEDFANNFDGIQVCLSKEMRKHYDNAVQMAKERAESSFSKHPGSGFSAEYCEQMFISVSEAQELCEKKPGKWAGYIELPPDEDPESEVGVIMLKPGGKLLGVDKGVPAEWTAFLHNFEVPEEEDKPKKKQKREKAKKSAFEPTRPIPPWRTLMQRANSMARATELFVQAGAQHALARAASDPRAAAFVMRGGIFRPKNIPSRLAPLTTYIPQKPSAGNGGSRAIMPARDMVLFESQHPRRSIGAMPMPIGNSMVRSTSMAAQPIMARNFAPTADRGPPQGLPAPPRVASNTSLLRAQYRNSLVASQAEFAQAQARIWVKTPAVLKSSMSLPTL